MKLPEHIAVRFDYASHVFVPTKNLFVGLLTGSGINYCNVSETPHYEFVSGYFENDTDLTLSYMRYNSKFLKRPTSRFFENIQAWDRYGLDLRSFPIIAYQRRANEFLVLDGFHRLAFATYKNVENIHVAMVRRKSIFNRIIRKLNNE